MLVWDWFSVVDIWAQVVTHVGSTCYRTIHDAHYYQVLTVSLNISVFFFFFLTITLTSWQETSPWRQIHRLAVPPLSDFQTEVWKEICAEIKNIHEQPAAFRQIQWIFCWMSLKAAILFPFSVICWMLTNANFSIYVVSLVWKTECLIVFFSKSFCFLSISYCLSLFFF